MAISTSFSTALTGLKAHQTAIDVTSNNISNASNPDYVRERAVFSTLNPINSIPGDIGTGVQISSIYRITDTFLFNRYTSTSATFANLDTQEQYLKEIATYFPDVTDNGLYKDMEDFFNAWQTFASNPNDGAVKVDLAAKTQALADNIKTLKGKLEDIQKSINDSLNSKLTEANNIIKQIAELNKEITAHEANNESNANELRDKRDALEKRLKELLDVKVFKSGVTSQDAQGAVTTDYEEDYQISLGGYPLVDNSTYHELSIESLSGNPMIGIEKQDYSVVDITKSVTGGEIGALLNLRGTDFDKEGNPTNGTLGNLMTSLDSLANGLIRSVNSIYSYSAQESVETDVISSPNTISPDLTDVSLSSLYNNYKILKSPVRDGNLILNVYDDQGNLNTATEIKVAVSADDSINDVIQNINNELTNAGITDVEAKLVNGQLKFVNSSDSSETSKILVKDDGAQLFTALNQIEYQPLNQVNDTQLPLPLKNGDFDIVVYDSDGNAIAKRTITVNMDSKDPKYSTIEGILAQINTPGIDDNGDNNLNNDVDDYYQAEFINGKLILSKKTDQNTYVGLDNDNADFGGAFGINKFFDGNNASNIQLRQELQDDPSLIKASKTPNSGDNTIANSVLQLQYDNINFYVNGKTQSNTIYGFYRGLTADLANQTQIVSSKKESTQTLLTSISNEYYSLSGVNIDEELVNLEQYQRGYQANAKVITTINQMLDALFSIKQ
ncbi:flagellar hook-associated protein FlgK [Nautilia profundicola AmH]|uniref:Flagellar hook-associated protein 1 n=1 Tax=Nautilia profundicola (strain ATCC BAA-1463 / DSM 18972 / AmH) TaxID=598659 RepID=B9L674_NAUPA|nr:flagellar hook-associated protein FlgK [Nautilia profundicola]ACM93036.1 flagellar hook-associated protein FlgK [Nautilia profundicola AmH]